MSHAPLHVVGLDALQEVVDCALAYQAVSSALAAIDSGHIDTAEELALTLRNRGEIHIKGGWLTSQPHVVFKIATGGFPAGPNAGCSILLDANTGAPAMIFDDHGWLTEMRTAAAGAVTTDLLGVEGPLDVAILGTGAQARYQLQALHARRSLRSVRVWGRDPAKAQQLAAETDSRSFDSIQDAVDGADVIVTTTSAREPILFGRHLAPGVHITAVGADMRGKRELAADVLDQADLIAADDPATCARVGELQYDSGLAVRTSALASLHRQSGMGKALRSSTDITVADLCGIGAYDASIAAAALAALGL